MYIDIASDSVMVRSDQAPKLSSIHFEAWDVVMAAYLDGDVGLASGGPM